MENFKNKFGNLKGILTVALVAISILVIAGFGLLKTKITVNQNQAADELFAGNQVLTSEDIIKKACLLLGKRYGRNGEKGGNAYTTNPTFLDASKFNAVDCSGLVYWALGSNGVRTVNVSDFSKAIGLPVDTTHWLTYQAGSTTQYWKEATNKSGNSLNPNGKSIWNANLNYYLNGNKNKTYKIKVLKANASITNDLRYYQYKVGNVTNTLPAGTVVVSFGENPSASKTADHAWITLGNLGTSDPAKVKSILVNMGVNANLLNVGTTIKQTGGNCQYWRIESTVDGGVFINNGNPGTGDSSSGKSIDKIWAFQLAEDKGDYTVNLFKMDENGREIDFEANTFEVSKKVGDNYRTLSQSEYTTETNSTTGKIRKIVIKEDLTSIPEGMVYTYKVEEKNAPSGLIKYNKPVEFDIRVVYEARVQKKIGLVQNIRIGGKAYKTDASNLYDNSNVYLSFLYGNINVKIKNKKPEGKYNVNIIKKNMQNGYLSGAQFSIEKILQNKAENNDSFIGNWETVTTRDFDGTFDNEFTFSNNDVAELVKIEESSAPTGYIISNKQLILQIFKRLVNNEYKIDHVNVYALDKNEEITPESIRGNDRTTNGNYIGTISSAQTTLEYNPEDDTNTIINMSLANNKNVEIVVKNKKVDLVLKKKIIEVDGKEAKNGTNNPDFNANQNRFISDLNESYVEYDGLYADVSTLGRSTNALYYMNKTPIEVSKNSTVKYALYILNEGEVNAKAGEIKDYVPAGLTVTGVSYNGNDITYGYDQGNNVLTILLSEIADYIPAFNGNTLSFEKVIVTCTVNENATGVLTNVAEITSYMTEDGIITEDVDSKPDNWVSPNGDGHNQDTDKSTDEWRNYSTDEPDGWKDSYVAQDNNGKGDDDDFEKVIVKPTAELVITKTSGGVKVDDVTFDITRDNEETEENVAVDENKEIIRKFDFSAVENSEVTYKISEQPNADYYQLEAPIELRVVTEAGRLKGYYFDYKFNDIEVSSRNMVTSVQTFKCQLSTGIVLDVKVQIDVNNSKIYIDISNVKKVETSYKIRFKKISGGDPENTVLSGVQFNGTKTINGVEEPISLTTGSDGYTPAMDIPVDINNLDFDSFSVSEVLDPINNARYTALNEKIKIQVYKEIKNNVLGVQQFNVGVNNAFSSVETEIRISPDGRDIRRYVDNNGAVYYIECAISEQDGIKCLDVIVTNPSDLTIPVRIRKVNNQGDILDGAEIKVYRQMNGTKYEIPADISSGVVNIEDTVEPGNRTITYLVYETKTKNGYENCFIDKYVKLDVTVENGVVTNIAHNVYYKANVAVQDQDILDLISSRIVTETDSDTGNEKKIAELTIENTPVKKVDLALKKVISQIEINGEYKDVTAANGFLPIYDRLTGARVTSNMLLDFNNVTNSANNDAEYLLNKTPIYVMHGTKVKYQIRIYNEGSQIDATASEIKDYLPNGLKLLNVYYRNESTPLSSSDYTYDEDLNIVTIKALKDKLISKYDVTDDVLSMDYVTVECEVLGDAFGRLTNIAEITKYQTEDDEEILSDYDSTAGNWNNPVKSFVKEAKDLTQWTSYIGSNSNEYEQGEFKNYYGQEDDDDFEVLTVVVPDLALKKVITKVGDTPESELSDKYKRLKDGDVDVYALNMSRGRINYINGFRIYDTTAMYSMNKTPINVGKNETVTYQIRIYNESGIEATASEIKDYIPKGLRLAKDADNNYCVYYADSTTPLASKYYNYNSDTNVLTINALSSANLSELTNDETKFITPYDGGLTTKCQYVTVVCEITGEATGLLTNVAEISEYETLFGKTTTDRDSSTVADGEWQEPENTNKNTKDGKSGPDWANYYDNIKDGEFDIYPGQEDDDDFEKIYVNGTMNIKINKYSTDSPNGLEGVEMNVTTSIPAYSQPITDTYTTDENGCIDLGDFELNNDPTAIGDILIKEISAENYEIIDKDIRISFEKSIQDDKPIVAGYKIFYGDEELSYSQYNKGYWWISDSAGNLVRLSVSVNKKSDSTGYNVAISIENVIKKGKYALRIQKKNNENNLAISGAKFSVEFLDWGIPLADEDYFEYKEVTTGLDGYADVADFAIKNDIFMEYPDRFLIKEIETPLHFVKLKDRIVLSVDKAYEYNTNGKVIGYKITGIQLANANGETVKGNKVTLEGVRLEGTDKTVDVVAEVKDMTKTETGEIIPVITITVPNIEKKFDLSLRKYIINAGDKNVERWSEDEITEDNLIDGTSTTATYNNAKEPVIEVYTKDIVTYGIKVFNEGEVSGYAEYVIDDVPEGLEVVAPEFDENNNPLNLNANYGWKMYKLVENEAVDATEGIISYKGNTYVVTDDPTEAKIIGTDYLSKAKGEEIIAGDSELENPNFLKAYDPETMETLSGKEVRVEFKVKESNKPGDIIENKAQIFEHADETGNKTITDRDSTPGVWEDSPRDDDQDYERIVVVRSKEYDLALRKFITKVNDKELENSREPQVDCRKLIAGSTTADYNHPKDPVLVKPQDVVDYTLRIYNEGKDDAYAEMVMDDVPDGVEMIAPEYDETGKPLNLNAEYGWEMYRLATEEETADLAARPDLAFFSYDNKVYARTNDAKEAVIIKTNYLSHEKDATANLIKAFNPINGTMKPENYRDVKVQFVVKEQEDITEEKILINYAQIGEIADENGNGGITDRDSTPGQWIDDEDDQDIEKLKLGYFDLALYKWVSTAIVTEDGKTTEYASNHSQSDKSNVVNVSIPKDKLNKVTVKFKYQIKVENEGTIPGKALEIKDHLPEGLKFVAEDNKEFGWVENEDGTIVTDYLKDTVLNPGETAEVTVVATWINGSDNFGKKINYAEISKDENDLGWPDKDSTPDNFTGKPVEDDEDGDEVLLQIRTGASATVYLVIGLVAMLIVAGGAFGIKKFVVNK